MLLIHVWSHVLISITSTGFLCQVNRVETAVVMLLAQACLSTCTSMWGPVAGRGYQQRSIGDEKAFNCIEDGQKTLQGEKWKVLC